MNIVLLRCETFYLKVPLAEVKKKIKLHSLSDGPKSVGVTSLVMDCQHTVTVVTLNKIFFFLGRHFEKSEQMKGQV